jgi:plasmid stabilization system protein ParE
VTPVVFSDEARNGLRDARAFYAAISAGLADRFATEVERAMRLIAEYPSAWTPIGRGLRRVVLQRLPYALVYRDSETVQRVVAVARTRRARDWRGRR